MKSQQIKSFAAISLMLNIASALEKPADNCCNLYEETNFEGEFMEYCVKDDYVKDEIKTERKISSIVCGNGIAFVHHDV